MKKKLDLRPDLDRAGMVIAFNKRIGELERENAAHVKTIAKLQRSNKRQGEEIIAMMNKSWARQHEIEKLERALVDCWRHPEYARKIVERAAGRAVKRWIPEHVRNGVLRQIAGE